MAACRSNGQVASLGTVLIAVGLYMSPRMALRLIDAGPADHVTAGPKVARGQGEVLGAGKSSTGSPGSTDLGQEFVVGFGLSEAGQQ